MKLPDLNFPEYDFRLRENGSKPEIFDPARKIWVKLTPEEWVRQHCIRFINNELNVALSLISIEKKLVVHGFERRYDILVFNSNALPVMLVECKAPAVSIENNVLEQACVYNLRLKVEYLLITNGLKHYFAKMDLVNNSFTLLEEFPPGVFE